MIPFTRLGLQQMQMLGAGAPTAGLPRFITDIFNLLQSSLTYAGGPLTVTDYLGNLVTSPAGVPALEGGRLATTVAEGATLGPELFTGDLTTGAGIAATGEDATHIVSFSETGLRYQSDTTTPVLTVVFINGGLTIGKKYQHKVTFTTVSGSIKANGVASTALNSEEVYGDNALSPNYTIQRLTANTDVTISNISVREVIPTWYDTEIDGTPIQPSISIPTRSGTKQWYQEPFANPFGYSNWPARTNKVTCRKFNPVDTTNFVPFDETITVTVVDDVAAIAAAGLQGICTTGKVYEITSVTSQIVNISGPTGNTNQHSYSAYIRVVSGAGGGYVALSGAGGGVGPSEMITSSAYAKAISSIAAPSSTAVMRIYCSVGTTLRVILPQLEEGAFATPPIFDPLNDSLTSITRAATNLTDPLTLAPQLQLVVIPATTGTAGTMLDDGTNKLSYNGTNLIFTDGVTTLSAAATLTAGTAYTIGVKGLAGDWALSLNTVDLDTDATGTVVAWATAKLGRNDADGDYFAGYFPNVAGYVGTDVNWHKTTLGA
jgi:hypothetical protein